MESRSGRALVATGAYYILTRDIPAGSLGSFVIFLPLRESRIDRVTFWELIDYKYSLYSEIFEKLLILS